LAEIERDWPFVTFIISAYNEEQVIGQKLQNTLELDYPKDKIEIIVISDASNDKTDNIVQDWAGKYDNILLVRQNQRKGKSAGLNVGIRNAKGDVVVFSDANAFYKNDSIYELVKYFANPDVGYIIGAALYNEETGNESTDSESLYWKFEIFVKKIESKFYSVVGGDGAIYAIHRKLFWNLEDDDINDFVNPLQIVAKGYKGLFNPEAICYEDAAGDFQKEFNRKRRIVNRSWRALKRYIGWFNAKSQFKYLFELFSHKVIRWFSMFFFIITYLTNLSIILISPSAFYVFSFLAQSLLIILALMGYYLNRKEKSIPRLAYIPYYYFLVNFAALLGIIDETKGVKYTVWEHVRESSAEKIK
jgi:cellulose synthase/poly-beta-1,6-N-acetylglucosamine synthase-like glycosyltransferase